MQIHNPDVKGKKSEKKTLCGDYFGLGDYREAP